MPDPTISLGLLVGLVVGSFGGGGAILTVPILVYVVGMDTAAATTSSLIIVAATSIAGLEAHARGRRVRWVDGLIFGLLGIVGATVGSQLSMMVAAPVLLGLLTLVMVLVATLMIVQNVRNARSDKRAQEGAPLPALAPAPARSAFGSLRLIKVVIAATVVGMLTGFFGVGGGWAVVPALTLALGFTMPQAVGTSLLVMVLNAITALITRFGSAHAGLDIPTIVGFSAFAVAGSLIGGHVISRRFSGRSLSYAFAGLLIAVAIFTSAMNAAELWRVVAH